MTGVLAAKGRVNVALWTTGEAMWFQTVIRLRPNFTCKSVWSGIFHFYALGSPGGAKSKLGVL